MRIPLAVDLKITNVNGSDISDYDAGLTNCIVKKKGSRTVVTQRPSLQMFEDASDTAGIGARGRAIYYWGTTDARYIVNANKIYKASQASTALGTITNGTKKCKFTELDTLLGLFDFENGEAWTINSAGTVTQITDVDFPPNQTPAIALAYGVAQLDKYVFVLDANGDIYNCDLNDLTSWNALDFLNAERYPDGGTYIGRHHDNIVAIGPRSIEFFYDASNSSGSPLARRADISYTFGANNGESFWQAGDRIFGVFVNEAGGLMAGKIETFGLKKISSDDIDSFLTQAIIHNGYGCDGSGFVANGHYYFLLTLYQTPSDKSPERTIVYDDTAGLWYPDWHTTLAGHTTLPLVDWSVRSSGTEHIGEGILQNGDLIAPLENLVPQDVKDAGSYVTSGYVATGFVQEIGSTGTAIDCTIRTGQEDFGSSNRKIGIKLKLVGDKAKASQSVSVNWSNDNSNGFSTHTARTVDMNNQVPLRALGRFESRNHQLDFTATEILEFEAIDLDVVETRETATA